MRKVLLLILVAGSLFFVFYLWARKNVQAELNLKNYPVRYAYHNLKNGPSIVLVAEDTTCFRAIKQFHENVETGRDERIPGCFSHGLPVNSKIYLIEDSQNSDFVKVAHFYLKKNDVQKYFIGYVLRRMVHKKATDL